MKNSRVKKSRFDRYIFGALIALELLMSFTFLGYVQIPPVSFTTAYIPILIAGRILGTGEATAVGFVFGAASLYKASASYILWSDRLFSPLYSTNPVGSVILSVGTRTLFGFLSGLMYKVARKSRRSGIWCSLVTALSIGIHALLVYIAMRIFFPTTEALSGSMSIRKSDIIMIFMSIFIAEGAAALYNSRKVKRVRSYVDGADRTPYASGSKKKVLFTALALFLLMMALIAMFYFADRADYMFKMHGIEVSGFLGADLLQLQGQFLLATLSLNVITMLILIAVYRYMSYKEYLGEFDALTGVMGRRMFMRYCDELSIEPACGWMLFVDVDNFKEINDTYGHAFGDKVLSSVAGMLCKNFHSWGTVGRLGGDEFAVVIERPMGKEKLSEVLEALLKDVPKALPEHKVGCSVGVARFCRGDDVEHILEEADSALYEAKSRGRACYVFK